MRYLLIFLLLLAACSKEDSKLKDGVFFKNSNFSDLHVAEFYLENQEYDKLIELCNEQMSLEDNQPTTELDVLLGLAYFNKNDYELAYKHLESGLLGYGYDNYLLQGTLDSAFKALRASYIELNSTEEFKSYLLDYQNKPTLLDRPQAKLSVQNLLDDSVDMEYVNDLFALQDLLRDNKKQDAKDILMKYQDKPSFDFFNYYFFYDSSKPIKYKFFINKLLSSYSLPVVDYFFSSFLYFHNLIRFFFDSFVYGNIDNIDVLLDCKHFLDLGSVRDDAKPLVKASFLINSINLSIYTLRYTYTYSMSNPSLEFISGHLDISMHFFKNLLHVISELYDLFALADVDFLSDMELVYFASLLDDTENSLRYFSGLFLNEENDFLGFLNLLMINLYSFNGVFVYNYPYDKNKEAVDMLLDKMAEYKEQINLRLQDIDKAQPLELPTSLKD